MGAMGAAEPLQSVLWVKQERCAVSLEPARALLRWWRSPGTEPSAPDAGECGGPGLVGPALHPLRGLRSRSASGRPGLGGHWREEETWGTGSGGQGTRSAGYPRCRALVPSGLRIPRPLAGNRPGAEGPDIPGTGMTKPLEVLEGEGKSGRPQPPAHPRDPKGNLLLVLLSRCSGTPGQNQCFTPPSSNTVNLSTGEAQRRPDKDFL